MKMAVRAYLGSIAGVGAATAATFLVQTWIGTSMSILFFPAVVVPAIYGGFGPALCGDSSVDILAGVPFHPAPVLP